MELIPGGPQGPSPCLEPFDFLTHCWHASCCASRITSSAPSSLQWTARLQREERRRRRRATAPLTSWGHKPSSSSSEEAVLQQVCKYHGGKKNPPRRQPVALRAGVGWGGGVGRGFGGPLIGGSPPAHRLPNCSCWKAGHKRPQQREQNENALDRAVPRPQRTAPRSFLTTQAGWERRGLLKTANTSCLGGGEMPRSRRLRRQSLAAVFQATWEAALKAFAPPSLGAPPPPAEEPPPTGFPVTGKRQGPFAGTPEIRQPGRTDFTAGDGLCGRG